MLYRPYGPTAWLIEDIADPISWAAGLEELGHTGIHEIVPAKETVLVLCERVVHAEVGRLLGRVSPVLHRRDLRDVNIDVVYDGDDLADVAERVGLSREAVIQKHVASQYTVEFCGFSPGFAYLGGLDDELRVPRRSSPRTQVPAGSVAIASDYSCVYPSQSPGGWHLLGRTTAEVWKVGRKEPALLTPGTTVRFKQVRA
jgi:KipI family sensor histidine kinase inhibitor